ncbi:sulfatase [Halobellus sp. Atlit-31R]|nr:sulfatase [Halobellus sp. Atlit-31R]
MASGSESPTPEKPTTTADTVEAASDAPNVCLVVLDSVRAANCSLYGARRDTTPYLSELATESTVYHQARAPSNWSLPSHVSLFTGLETHVHGVTVHDRLEPGHTVFERLATEHGYDTGLFTENGFVGAHEVGLRTAFETVRSVPSEFGDEYATTEVNPGPDGFYYADRFLEWVDGHGDGDQWAACVNLMDAHRPFEPAEPYDEWGDDDARELQADLGVRWEWAFHGGDTPMWALRGLESLYDGGIRQADAIVERLVEGLRARGVLDDTLLVVCADHGDGFGEPGVLDEEPTAVSHIVPMHESLLHVPLVVRYPEQRDREQHAERRDVFRPAALTRFPSVALDAASGRELPTDAFVPDGPVVASKQPVTGDLRERYVEACAEPEPFFAPSRAVYRAADDGTDTTSVQKTYHWGKQVGELQVYDAQSVSPRSTTTLDEAATHLDAAFDRFDSADVRQPREDQSVSVETKERLAALGYY